MKKNKGFTIVEISIIISIVAILLCLSANIFVRMRAEANYNECNKRLKAMSDLIKKSTDNNGDYPKDKAVLTPIIGKYNKDNPQHKIIDTCPVDNQDYEYMSTYDPISGKKGFKCWCPGEKSHIFVIKNRGYVLKTEEHLPCFNEDGSMEPSSEKDKK